MKIKTILLDLILIVSDSAVFSVSVNMFSSPDNILQGGLTGVGIVANYLFSLPTGTVMPDYITGGKTNE